MFDNKYHLQLCDFCNFNFVLVFNTIWNFKSHKIVLFIGRRFLTHITKQLSDTDKIAWYEHSSLHLPNIRNCDDDQQCEMGMVDFVKTNGTGMFIRLLDLKTSHQSYDFRLTCIRSPTNTKTFKPKNVRAVWNYDYGKQPSQKPIRHRHNTKV